MSQTKLDIREYIVDVPDFPKKGIVFKDISPLLADPKAFEVMTDEFAQRISGMNFKKIFAIESRGFLLGSALASRMNVGLGLIRKPGKLPRKTYSESYLLEYGTDSLEIHQDAVSAGEDVLIIDDVLATGGTAFAAETLLKKAGAKVSAHLFLMELDFLKGRSKLGADVVSLLTY